jgi:hypothetical protein
MKKTEFEQVLDHSFRNLEAGYGLKRIETAFRAGGVTARFQNATTLVTLEYEIKDEPWLAITDINNPENSSTLGWLLVELGVIPTPTPEQAFRAKYLSSAALPAFIQKMCDQLQEHGEPLLRGDFSMIPRLQERAQKYALECKHFAEIRRVK